MQEPMNYFVCAFWQFTLQNSVGGNFGFVFQTYMYVESSPTVGAAIHCNLPLTLLVSEMTRGGGFVLIFVNPSLHTGTYIVQRSNTNTV